MIKKITSSSQQYNELCKVITEIDWSKVPKFDENFFKYTLTTEIVLFASLKYMMKKLIRKSKIDKGLSEEITNLVSNKYIIRIIDYPFINSFSDDEGTIFVTDGLVKLLTRDELIAIILHEIGHGHEKLKILYDQMMSNKKVVLFKVLAPLIKKKVYTDSLTKTTLYLLAYTAYMSTGKPPFKGAYKWSYSDYAVKLGYWDQYASAIKKIDAAVVKKNEVKLANDLIKTAQDNPDSIKEIEKPFQKSLEHDDDEINSNVITMLKTMVVKIDPKFVFKAMKIILRK